LVQTESVKYTLSTKAILTRMTDQEEVIVLSYSSFYCRFLCSASSVYLSWIYIGCYSKALSSDCRNFRHWQVPFHSGSENDELTVWPVQSETFTYVSWNNYKFTGASIRSKIMLASTVYGLTLSYAFNLLTPNDHYSGRTAPLTSKLCILYIYSTSIGTEYFKHGIYSPFFPLQNALCFIILTYLVSLLFTFYIQGVLKLKKIIPAPKV